MPDNTWTPEAIAFYEANPDARDYIDAAAIAAGAPALVAVSGDPGNYEPGPIEPVAVLGGPSSLPGGHPGALSPSTLAPAAPKPTQTLPTPSGPSAAPTGQPGLASGLASGLIANLAPALGGAAVAGVDSVTSLIKSNGPAILVVAGTLGVLAFTGGGKRARR